VEARGRASLAGDALRFSAELEQFDLAALVRHFAPDSPLQTGSADLTASAELSGEALHVRVEGDAAGRARRGPRAAGALSADVVVRRPGDPRHRSLSGSATLRGWGVGAPGAPLLRELADQAVTIEQLTGQTGDGELRGQGRIDLTDLSAIGYAGQLHLTGLDVPAALALLAVEHPVRRGALALDAEFSGVGVESLTARFSGAVQGEVDHDMLTAAGGQFRGDIRLAEPLNDPARLGVHGSARLDEWSLRGPEAPLVEQLGISLLLLGRSGDVSSLRGRSANGRIIGRGRLDAPPGEALAYSGAVELEGVSIDRLVGALGREAPEELGAIDAEYEFRGAGFDWAELDGRGSLYMGDSGARHQAVVTAVLAQLDLADPRAGRFDVSAAFRHEGTLATIDSAHLAAPMLAIVIEPGGVIDMQSRQVDVYVVAGALDELDRFIGRLPVLNLAAGLTTALTRLHVAGPFDDRQQIRVTKQPLQDLSEGTIHFFGSVVESGGQISRDLWRSLQRMGP
jgi:hypothetical protein